MHSYIVLSNVVQEIRYIKQIVFSQTKVFFYIIDKIVK